MPITINPPVTLTLNRLTAIVRLATLAGQAQEMATDALDTIGEVSHVDIIKTGDALLDALEIGNVNMAMAKARALAELFEAEVEISDGDVQTDPKYGYCSWPIVANRLIEEADNLERDTRSDD